MLHKRRLLTLAACLGAVPTLPVQSAPVQTTRVPAGFESLLEGQVEQIEVQLFGRSLGLMPLKVKLDSVQFLDPEGVASALPLDGEGESDLRASIAEALRPPLPRNGNLACPPGVREGCGYLETKSAAVIYDENRGVALLFLAKEWVEHIGRPDNRYLAVSGRAENALIHRQYVNFSAGRDYRSLSLQGAGALGLTHTGYLGTTWSLLQTDAGKYSNSDFRFDNLYFRQDFGNERYGQVGRMDQRNLSGTLGGNFGFNMLPLPRFDGLRFGTTQAYLNSTGGGDATPVTILLTRDARVDVYRGNELLGTQYLNAGVQSLDTANLPSGSYTLSLRVFENGVLSRSETVPFSKTGGVLGDGKTQWFVQGGRVAREDSYSFADRADTGRRAAIQAGLRTGLARDLYLTTGVAAINGSKYSETRLDWQQGFEAGVLTVAATYFLGTDGSRGNSQQLGFTNGASWNLYRYQMRGASCDTPRPAPGDVGCYDSLNATVSFPIGKWLTFGGYTYSKTKSTPYDPSLFYYYPGLTPGLPPFATRNDRSGDMVSRAIQLGVNRSFQWRRSILNTRIGLYRNTNSAGRAASDQGVYFGVTISGASQPPDASGKSSYSTAGADLRTSRNGPSQIGYSAGYTQMWQDDSYRELGVNVAGYRDESYSGSLRGRIDGRYGDLSATLANTYQKADGRNYPSVTGTYSSSFAASASGFYWGTDNGRGEPAAALVVKVEDNDDDSRAAAAELRSNSGRPFKLGFGERGMIPVEGYQVTYAELRDVNSSKAEGSVNIASGGGSNEYFLPPGKLIAKEIAAEITYIYVGRALSPEGKPMAGAQVLNASVPALDDDGGFFVDAASRLSMLYLVREGELFGCPMLVQGKRDVVQIVGEARCEHMAAANLPDQLRMQPRVGRLLNELRQQASAGMIRGRL